MALWLIVLIGLACLPFASPRAQGLRAQGIRPGEGPSFSCSGTLSSSEAAICGSRLLSTLDRQINQSFAIIQAIGADPNLVAEQRNWLRQRDACGSDPNCLRDAMNVRLRALRLVQRSARPQPSAVGASPAVRNLDGSWAGHYACGANPDTTFELTVAAPSAPTPGAAPTSLTGTFRFTAPHAPGGQPGVIGSFRLVGHPPDGDGSFVLAPTEWIERPPGFTTVGLSGRISADGASLSGNLLGCGGASFAARRAGADGAPLQAGPHLPPVPLAAGLGGRLAAADSLDAQCKVLADWGRPLLSRPDARSAPVDTLQREALPLFQDDVFRPVFGLSYVLTTPEQRRPVYFLLVRDCPQKADMRELDNYDLAPPWMPTAQGGFSYAVVTARLVDLGPAQMQVAAAITRLSGLSVTPDALTVLDRIAVENRATVEQLDESRRKDFARALAEARARITAGLLDLRVQQAASLPADPSSFATLQRLSEDLVHSDLPETAKGKGIGEVRAAIQAIATRLVATNVAAAAKAPITLVGLAEATTALRRAEATLGTVRANHADSDELDRSTAPIAERRRTIMADADVQHDFAHALDAAAADGSEGSVAAAARPYFEPGELDQPYAAPFKQAVAAAADRIAAVQHAAAEARRRDEAARQAAHAAAEAADSAAAQGGPGGGHSLLGEPSSDEMLQAVSVLPTELGAGQQDLADRCARREFTNDPALAMMCAAQSLSGGPMRVGVTAFRKISCEKAVGKPGYVCDYTLGVGVSNGQDMGVLGHLMSDARSQCTGRFVMSGGLWILEDRDCH